ncbi:hypothetical protein C7293_08685 [filamentous cyanobacterium CCT1]|nr:hypothetical protein C7293_08685 [filamentous cyanobacterium CCT1]PSN81110.1 hypothetical protein C8B47_03095 [filamentous cyanobacterium CCP4]
MGVGLRFPNLLNLKWISFHQLDIAIFVGLAIATAIFTYFGTYQIPDPIFTDFYAQDVWFGSDIPTVFGNITSVESDFGRNNKHPLFPLIVFPLVFLLSKILSLDPLSAVRVLIVIVSIVWIGSMYFLLRLMDCHRIDAILFSLLGGVSTASIFWLVVPESFSFGSITILLGLIFAVFAQQQQLSDMWFVAVNIITVSVTITNSMVGIFATIINRHWKKVLQIGTVSLLLATGMWIVQRIIFTNAGFPFQPGTFIGEKKFMATPQQSNLWGVLVSFFYQTMVMPETQLLSSADRPDWIILEPNIFSPASGGLWGAIAVFSWTGLLGLGLWGFFTTKRHLKFRIVLGLTLIAQILMHSIYGVEETFIYSLHFIPLLLTLAAFSVFTRLRPLSLVLAAILLVSAGINNRAQFDHIASALWNYGTPQQQVIAQMKIRTDDPWPRSEGHIVLAKAGSPVEGKAFYEPGGSFSPNPGSFGISIWVVDQRGNLKATSDSIPLRKIEQKLVQNSLHNTSGVLAKTPFYEASWSVSDSSHWQLDLKHLAKADTRLSLVIRSAGPAGGAIPSLDWNGQQLIVSNRWVVQDIPETANVYLGSESTKGWIQEKLPISRWEDPYGWGYARIELGQGENFRILVEDRQFDSVQDYHPFSTTPNVVLDLPNQQFTDSLFAQASHLLMGLVGSRTHPTDPISYPFPRFRDGAYQLVALARVGQLEVAKKLSPYFAENDFFNGTIPEADIPALGIWALEEVASKLQQPEYDQWLWPHVQRKADLIAQMLSSHRPGYPVFASAKLPHTENPDFLKVDLIAGKMQNLPGVITLDPSTSAISYRALMDAATLADRMQQPKEAQRWRTQARQLKTTWQKAVQEGRTAPTDGLWPSGIASSDTKTMAQTLQNRWTELWAAGELRLPYQAGHLELAEAHQWLLLNQPEHVWATLNWFWDNQASPGLYTWGGEETDEFPMPESFSQWHKIRGWVNPSNLTPHYWTAAEMLLLQLDMLAYVDQTSSQPTLVVGSGIPKEWLKQPLSAKGLWANGNLVNWTWDGQQMTVQISGQGMPVRLGDSFSAKSLLNVEFLPKIKLEQANSRGLASVN